MFIHKISYKQDVKPFFEMTFVLILTINPGFLLEEFCNSNRTFLTHMCQKYMKFIQKLSSSLEMVRIFKILMGPCPEFGEDKNLCNHTKAEWCLANIDKHLVKFQVVSNAKGIGVT